MEAQSELFVIALMLFGIYLGVLLMILADLWSGVRKAKERGELRTSTGYKRTIDKIARYYNALIALTVIDAMQLTAVWYLDNYYAYKFPVIPIVTLIGAIGISLVEVKSIFENSGEKAKKEATELTSLVSEMVKAGHKPDELAKALLDYLNKGKEASNESK